MESSGREVIGSGICKVIVTDDGIPVPGAKVTMFSSDFSVCTSAVSNESGIAQLHPGDIDHTTLYLKAVKPGYVMTADNPESRRK